MKNKSSMILIKNMVCQRCILAVQEVFDRLNVAYLDITLGEVVVERVPAKETIRELERELQLLGFELIESRTNKIIADIKQIVVQLVNNHSQRQKCNLSSLITDQLHYDYSYLSALFSSVEGKSIEQFYILQRIEKVKELIVYDQLSLSEIAFQTGFSSVHHLSAQFKKITGLTPSHFRKIRSEKRKSIDKL